MRTRKATFVCGLIAGILGILGACCLTVCAEALGAAGDMGGSIDPDLTLTPEMEALMAMCKIYGYVGLPLAILGLVSACLSSRSKIWCVIMIVCGLFFASSIITIGFDLFMLATGALFIIGGAVGLPKPNAGE